MPDKTGRRINLSRTLRQRQTHAERFLWAKLRNRQLKGVKFRRQQPLGPYIVDFISFEKKIIVEVDGGQHNTPSPYPSPVEGEGKTRDRERDAWLKERGYLVLRFWNNDLLANMDGVLEKIVENLSSPLEGAD
jgi:very-short-patch-repair endonuclease